MKYLSKSNIKYVLVRDNSKGAKAVYDIYDAKDTNSGVHYAEGGLTDSVYKLKSQTIVIDDKGKVVDEKMNGLWLKKNAKPIGSIEKSEIDNMESLQDWKDHIEGKTKSGDSGLSLNPTRVYKNAYGWVARTSTKEPINGYDYEITTMKRYNKVLLSDAQGGKDEAGGVGVKIFVYTPSQDPSIELVRTMPKMVNEKKVREQHEEAIEKFKYLYKEGKLSSRKYAHGGMTDSKKNISRIILSDDRKKVLVDTTSMAQANEVLYGISNSNKYSYIFYAIRFEDGKEISGSIDLEPHSFHKPHEKKILTWHLLTYYKNVSNLPSYFGEEVEVEIAKDLLDNYKLYAKGGEMSGKVEIGNFRRNIMGTLSFDMKLSNMRKTQDFIVYPVQEKTDYITIQSDSRFGKIEMTTGRGLMSQSHPNGAYGYHFQMDNKVKFQLSDEQLADLKMELAKTAGRNVGSMGVVSDNEFADKFAEGGGIPNYEPKEFDKPRGKTIYIVKDEDDDGDVVVDGYDNYDEAKSAHSRSKLKGYQISWYTEIENKKPPYVYESGVVLTDGRLLVKNRRGMEVNEYAKGGMTFGGKMHGAGMFEEGGEIEFSAKRKADNKNYSDADLKKELEEAKFQLSEFKSGNLKPSKVIGGGYKSSAIAKRLAEEWLNKQVAIYKSAIEMRKSIEHGAGMFAKGGKVEFIDSKLYRSGKSWYYKRFKGAIGSFAWMYDKKYNEGILYPFDDYDKEYYSHLKLKPNEVLLRYDNERMMFGEKFLIKFNLEKGLVYFMDSDRMSDDDDKNIIFQSRGIPLQYLVIEKDSYAKGGETEDESDYLWEGYDTSGVNREDLQTLLNLIDSHDISYDYQPKFDRLFFDMTELNREEQEFAKSVLNVKDSYAKGGEFGEDFGYHVINDEVTLKDGTKTYLTKGRYFWSNELGDGRSSGIYYLTKDGEFISSDMIKYPIYAKGGMVDENQIADLERKIKHYREVEKNESMARYYEEALYYLTQGKNQDILKHDKYAMGGTTHKSSMGFIPNKGNHRNGK